VPEPHELDLLENINGDGLEMRRKGWTGWEEALGLTGAAPEALNVVGEIQDIR